MRVEINKITGTKESKPSDIRMTDWTVNNWEKWKEGIEFNVKREDYLRQPSITIVIRRRKIFSAYFNFVFSFALLNSF